MTDVQRFDIDRVTLTLQSSLCDDDDVLLEHYIAAFEEINKFFLLLGSVFGFVSSDVRTKIDILDEFRQMEHTKDKFITIKTMITYEKQADLLNDSKFVSGCRTLLRLHRGLEFVYEFLTRLGELSETDKVHDCCKSAYNDTLAKHHPWIIRKGALVAMYTLPTQGELMRRVGVDVAAAEKLPEMLKHTKSVYDRTHRLYTEHDLHRLP